MISFFFQIKLFLGTSWNTHMCVCMLWRGTPMGKPLLYRMLYFSKIFCRKHRWWSHLCQFLSFNIFHCSKTTQFSIYTLKTQQTMHQTKLAEIKHISSWSVSFRFGIWFIFRPDIYPPSYEDSTDPEKQTFPLPVASTLKEQEVIHIPPPPYSKSSAEFISETYEQEQPPPYELSVEQLQQQQIYDQDSSLKVKSHLHPSTRENRYQWNTDYEETSERAAPDRKFQTGNE